MTTSNARIEANRRNASKSTGPQSAEGKAASRLNAFRHGMAGGGDLLGPGEDAQRVAERALAFTRELGATGAMGPLLAHRAALLSVRMERLAVGEMIAVGVADQQARAAFDADREEAIGELLAEAEAPDRDPTPALGALAECPDGLDRLLAAWGDLQTGLRSADPGGAARQVARWLGGNDPARAEPSLAELTRRVEAEIERLQARRGTMAGLTRAIDRARTNAGLLARFDPSPEATLARRYEAAAERGMYRAIRAIAEINRPAGLPTEDTGVAAGLEATLALWNQARAQVTPPPPDRPQSPCSTPPLASFRAAEISPLASFRAGPDPVADADAMALATTESAPEEGRRRRPDLQKLNQKLARSRR